MEEEESGRRSPFLSFPDLPFSDLPIMPAITLAICGVPVIISTRSPRFIRLFADYFRYYDPQIISSVNVEQTLVCSHPEQT
ncbi:MAG: hypothetical protein ABI977_04335, partial [Acidobacteriota bacterium]